MSHRNHYDLAQRNSSDRPLFVVHRHVTLASGTTSTVVTDQIIGGNTMPLLSAESADGAAIQASVYVSARDKGSLTLTHTAPGSDIELQLLLIG